MRIGFTKPKRGPRIAYEQQQLRAAYEKQQLEAARIAQEKEDADR